MPATHVKWPRYLLAALATLVVIAIAVPFFISLDAYIPQVEKQLSARLNEPVSIKSIKFAVLPLPHLTLGGITVGTTEYIKLGKVRVSPDLLSMLQTTRVIRNIEIDALTLTQKAIDKIPAWSARSDTNEPAQVRVENIRLDGAMLKLDKTDIGPLDVRLRFNGAGEPETASIATQDGKFKALLTPDKAKYLVEASARSWTLPAGPAIVFDELTVKGVTSLHNASLDEISLKLYGGQVTGKLTANWQKGLKVEGRFDISQVEMQHIAAMLSPGAHVSGKLNAAPVFSAAAASANQLMPALWLEAPFNVQNGTIHGVDIQRAATSLIKQGTTGGQTRFEQLSGHVVIEHGGYRFTRLKIASGALAADGSVSISPKKELSGRINAQVKAVGTSANVPLNVGGTVAAPLLYPTGGTMAGAAAGTVLLGPGFGTSVGAKVGGWAEGLFGKKQEK